MRLLLADCCPHCGDPDDVVVVVGLNSEGFAALRQYCVDCDEWLDEVSDFAFSTADHKRFVRELTKVGRNKRTTFDAPEKEVKS